MIIVPFVVKKYDRQRHIAGNLAVRTTDSDSVSLLRCRSSISTPCPGVALCEAGSCAVLGAKHDIAARCIRCLQSKRFMLFDKS